MKTSKVFLIIFIVSLIATLIIQGLEQVFGPDKVFFGAIVSIPLLLVWIAIQDTMKTKVQIKAIEKRLNQ